MPPKAKPKAGAAKVAAAKAKIAAAKQAAAKAKIGAAKAKIGAAKKAAAKQAAAPNPDNEVDGQPQGDQVQFQTVESFHILPRATTFTTIQTS